MERRHRASLLLTVALTAATAIGQEVPSTPVATVDGVVVTSGDLEFLYLSRKVPADQRERLRAAFVDQLVDAQLMRAFLASRNAKPNADDLSARVQFIRDQIKGAGDDPDRVLAKLGYSGERLKETLALPLAWQVHARRMIGDAQLRDEWAQRRAEFDGTRVRVSQIFLKAPAGSDPSTVAAAAAKLKALKTEIQSGKQSFAEAAKSHSEAPSKEAGGDVGFVLFHGSLPPGVSKAAFALKPGEVSDPVESTFGVHLVTATERKPGDLSLEDVRGQLFDRLQREAWDNVIRDLRSKAKIEKP